MKLNQFAFITSTLALVSYLGAQASERPVVDFSCADESNDEFTECKSNLSCDRTGIQAYVWTGNGENVECTDGLGGGVSTSAQDENWRSVEYLKLKWSEANAVCSVTNKDELWAYVAMTAGPSDCCFCYVNAQGWRIYIKESSGVTPVGRGAFSMKGGYDTSGTALFRVYKE